MEGDTVCQDTATQTCYTFNAADAAHIRRMGWNSIRLGVAWAGAQSTDADSLDASWVANLQAILRLCEAHGIHVVLDFHTDMVGHANCGWGVPSWFSQQAAPELIGKPLTTGLPYSLLHSLGITDALYINSPCGSNESAWAAHAGEPDYNLVNECCGGLSSGANNNALGYSKLAQATMDHLLSAGPGRDAFVRFWALVARAVADFPAAVGCELMNEPMSLRRALLFETWQAASDAIVAEVADMSVSISDLSEGAVIPAWAARLAGSAVLPAATKAWLQRSTHLFYAWHWYGTPKDAAAAVKNVQSLGAKWGVASMLTETMSCDAIGAAEAANISWSYWHWSQYCDTAPAFGGKRPPHSFGACILGWGGGTSNKTCAK